MKRKLMGSLLVTSILLTPINTFADSQIKEPTRCENAETKRCIDFYTVPPLNETLLKEEQLSLRIEAIKNNKEAIKYELKTRFNNKESLIRIKNKLKDKNVGDVEVIAEYEALADFFEETNHLNESIEVRKEFIKRTYKNGEIEPFKKLGELYQSQGLKGIKAFVNGSEVSFDENPFIKEGRTMIPIRAISESMKADVKWDPTTKKVNIKKGDITIELFLGDNKVIINGEETLLDVAPSSVNGRIFLPLRFVSEQLNSNVNWQPEGEIIIIDDYDSYVNNEKDTFMIVDINIKE